MAERGRKVAPVRDGTATGLRQVAERAGVALATASRVMTGFPGVSAELRNRVLRAAGDLGYAPNMLARGLRRRTSMTVGFVASDIANPLVSGIFRGAEKVLVEAGYSMLLTDSDGDPAADGARLALLRQRQVDGIITLPVAEDDADTLAAMRNAGPLVAVDRDLPEDVGASRVLSDHRPGVLDAVRHLLSLGHRRFALVAGRDVRPARERASAILSGLAEAELGGNALTVAHGTLTEEHGRAALDRLLAASRPPTAIVLGGNQLLVGALRHVRDRGLALGRDLSLVTCDDTHLARLAGPPIATVARDIALIGRTAGLLLLEQLGPVEPLPRTAVLPTWFVPGQSCGPPPA